MKSNDILNVNTKDIEMNEMEDKQPQNDEEHDRMDDKIDNTTAQEGKNEQPDQNSPTGTKIFNQTLSLFPRVENVIRHGYIKLHITLIMYFYIIYGLILCNVNVYWSIDLDSEDENRG